MGFKGNGSINASLSNYRVTPTYPDKPVVAPTPAPSNEPVHRETVAEAKQERPQLRGLTRTIRRDAKTKAKQEVPLPEGGIALAPLPKGQVMLIEKGANERTEAYWDSIRPIPLSEEEIKDYHVKDSVEVIQKSKPYQDSMDRIRNKPSFFGLLVGGYTYSNTFERRFISVESPTDKMVYNTVEGLVLNLNATYTQRYEDRRTYSLEPALRYGFSSKQFSPSLRGGYTFRPESFSRIGFAVGRTILDFDPYNNQPHTPFNSPVLNTTYTLLANRNYNKYYQRDGLEINYRTEAANGFFVNLAASYADRKELYNTTVELLRDVPGRAFTPNRPESAERPEGTGFGRSQAVTLDLGLTWQPGQQYVTRPDGKFNLYNARYPRLSLGLRQAFRGVLGSDVRFTRLELGAQKELGFGLFGETRLSGTAGTYLGSSDLTFVDYRHFAGNRTIFAIDFERQFQLLDYYRYSTAERYLIGRASHHFNGFFFNKLPAFRQLKWQEVATINYLYTPTAGHYAELGLGVEHIFKALRVDFFTSLQSKEKAGSGIRIGIGF
ncbi:DUF5686 family protein [Hymenobacter cellulosilyticus]|uniref:DUF5686 family protein n=1 Tax=Hymenobacter cellulosilyticus TaxID=2932248 RepID=A0A8T9Q8C9_9BACT|nr:DUF5686 family protein [Hymenobacter cellulosilyticus]UOQ73744.1 DUF5686 family protein [Hymenobacter cellulosilyticus]